MNDMNSAHKDNTELFNYALSTIWVNILLYVIHTQYTGVPER
jgi:hypothetical protein